MSTHVFSCEYCRIFKITCFEDNLETTVSIRYYFDTIGLKQTGFCTTYSFNILVSERKYKNNLKNRECQKKYILQFSYTVYNVYVMFYISYSRGFTKIFNVKICFLNLYSVHASRILDLSLEVILSPPK